MKYLNESLRNRLSKEDGQQIWDNFKKYSRYDDLKDLYSKTIPEIEKFEEKIIDYNLELEKIHIILRRFDEIMSEKASKLNIKEVY